MKIFDVHTYARRDKTNPEHLVSQMEKAEEESQQWSSVDSKIYETIEKWYNILKFPKKFDYQFKQALKDIKISDSIKIENFKETTDGKLNLLSFLYMCEKLKSKYEDKKIPEEILIDTLSDILIWNNIWSDIKDELYLGECAWLKNHLSMKLFKLGRLQFCMGKAECDISHFNISKGDNVLEIHIPAVGPLTMEECERSIEYAKEFFSEYFPEFEYKCFTCHSWLLDKSLSAFLEPTSNILKFQNMFEEIKTEESDAILKYVFTWNINRRKLISENPSSSFAAKVKEHALADGKFYETLGILKDVK